MGVAPEGDDDAILADKGNTKRRKKNDRRHVERGYENGRVANAWNGSFVDEWTR